MSQSPSLLKFHLLQKLDTLEDYLRPDGQQTADRRPLAVRSVRAGGVFEKRYV